MNTGIETEDAPGKQRTEEFQIAIKELKQENQTLEIWNAKLQEKVQKLKEKNKTQHEFSKKVRKMNIKLYWSNVVLKTKLQQENSKGKTSTQG
jgi:predicted RNase H-like nuclease (RuvC/YqgF family)